MWDMDRYVNLLMGEIPRLRDDGNGYHLFSPCGCNPLSVRLSTLHDLCSDWQVTYTE